MTGGRLQLLGVLLFSAVIRWILWPLAILMSQFSDRVKAQITGRPNVDEVVVDLARKRRQFDDCVVFFCSSAGEYEQAKPLIERLTLAGNVLCHVFFFSVSGAKFIKARKDSVSWALSPPDHVWAWGSLFAALRPSKTVIIRHEVWPAFLWIASQWGKVIIVDAVVPSLLGRQGKWKEKLNLAIKAWLLRFVDRICVVARPDQDFFERWLQIPPSKIIVTGDTKYDRVIERAREKRKSVDEMRSFFNEKWNPTGCDMTLIGGSVHVPDVELLMQVFSGDELGRIKILLVPHDVSSGNVARIYETVKNAGFSCELLSEIEASSFRFLGQHPRVILADEMGRLSDLYGIADFAWVGGAVHAKVHNVLEPAAWGLPVSCGLHFKNSQEAVALHKSGLLFAAGNAEALRRHWLALVPEVSSFGERTLQFAKSMAGASDTVINAVFKPLSN